MSTRNDISYNNGNEPHTSLPCALAKLDAPSNTVLVYEGLTNIDPNSHSEGQNRAWFTPSAINHFESDQYHACEPGFSWSYADNSAASFGNHDNNATPVATIRHMHSDTIVHPRLNTATITDFVDGSNNYIMCDGHVRFLDWGKVSNSDNSATLATPDKLGTYAATFAASDDQT